MSESAKSSYWTEMEQKITNELVLQTMRKFGQFEHKINDGTIMNEY